MKIKYIFGLLMLFLMIIFSCKKELEPQESSGVTVPLATDNGGVAPAASPEGLLNPNQNTGTTQQNVNQNTSALNPPHGQPGHRCDIAVGAPLNSTPIKSTPNPAVTSSSAPVIVKSNAAAVVTKLGMNPPHGQAGHQCDIAVGAPLNSAPNKVVPTIPNPDSGSPVPALLKLDSTATSPK
jgi:hypothetical protein